MWILTQDERLMRATPSATVEVRDGGEMAREEHHSGMRSTVITRKGFKPGQMALVLWRGQVAAPLAHGTRNQMRRLLHEFFTAAAQGEKTFNIPERFRAMMNKQKNDGQKDHHGN